MDITSTKQCRIIELEYKHEIGNSHNAHAVVIRKIYGEPKTVGYIPRRISPICSLFICQDGIIERINWIGNNEIGLQYFKINIDE